MRRTSQLHNIGDANSLMLWISEVALVIFIKPIGIQRWRAAGGSRNTAAPPTL